MYGWSTWETQKNKHTDKWHVDVFNIFGGWSIYNNYIKFIFSVLSILFFLLYIFWFVRNICINKVIWNFSSFNCLLKTNVYEIFLLHFRSYRTQWCIKNRIDRQLWVRLLWLFSPVTHFNDCFLNVKINWNWHFLNYINCFQFYCW